MTNIYRGNLIIPVRTQAEDPEKALQANRIAAREIARAMATGEQWGVYRNTYSEPQASTELLPVVAGVHIP